MKPVLVVSYVFPPLGGPGVFRWLKLTKYLPERGYAPIVLCADDPRYPHRDASLSAQIPSGVRVIRRPSREPSLHRVLGGHLWRTRLAPCLPALRRAFQFPDDKQPWACEAADCAIELVRREHPVAVITTSPPYSAHLVGRRIKRRLGLPWIADFRDPWADGPLFMNGLPDWVCRRHRRLERRVARSADHCLFVYPGGADRFCRRHGIPAGRATTLFNGFDPGDFAGWSPATIPNGRVEIVHTGSFYEAYNPSPLRRALDSAAFRRAIPLDRMRLTFVGGTGGVRFDDVPDLSVRVLGRVPHREALDYMRRAHVLLCVFTRETGRHNVTGKIFEYVAADRPILAVVPDDGAAADVVRRTRTGHVADPDDPSAIARALRACIDLADTGGAMRRRDPVEIACFDRRRQTGELVELLDRIVEGRQVFNS